MATVRNVLNVGLNYFKVSNKSGSPIFQRNIGEKSEISVKNRYFGKFNDKFQKFLLTDYRWRDIMSTSTNNRYFGEILADIADIFVPDSIDIYYRKYHNTHLNKHIMHHSVNRNLCQKGENTDTQRKEGLKESA